MKARFNYKSRKTIIITIAIIVLLALSATGVYVFTKGNDNAEAFTEGNTTVEGPSQNNEGEGTTQEGAQTVEPNEGLENNGEQTAIDTPTTGETTIEETQQEANNQGTTNNGVGTTTTTTGNVPNEEYVTERQEEVETLVYEGFLVGWTPISVASLADDISLNKVESNVAYTVEKVATLVNGESLERDEDGKITTKVKPGDTVTYVITVKNTGNVTLQNINVVDELVKDNELIDILKEGTIDVLAIGDKKEITVEYTVNQDDMDENEEITNTVRATVTDPTDPEEEIKENDDEIIPVNPYIEIVVTKEWEDADNQDGMRKEVTIQLKANNESVEGKTLTLNDGNSWTDKFENLPKYENGVEIVYTVEETTQLAGYTTEITGSVAEGYTVTNSHTPELVNSNGEIVVTKEWNDADNQDGMRKEVTIQLKANNESVEGKTLTLNDGNSWTDKFENLPKYENGVEIVYTVEETTQLAGYTTEITGSVAEGFTVTNKHTPELVNDTGKIAVEKVWIDGEGQNGIRQEITIQLKANDKNVEGKTLILNAEKSWTGEFTDLPKYENGKVIDYTVEEITKVSGYEKLSITGTAKDGFTVTNRIEQDTTEMTVSKVWSDGNNQDNNRPTSVEVQLYADGETYGNVVTLTETKKLQDDENTWKHIFTGLNKYDLTDGHKIEYTVKEIDSSGNAIDTNGTNGDYKVTYQKDIEHNVVTITNSYTPQKVNGDGKIAVTKVWKDDTENTRQNVTIKLTAKANNATVEGVSGKTLTLTAKNNWRGEFTDLPKYTNGKEISYTISENTIAGYDTKITGSVEKGFIVTNTHKPAPQLEIVKKAIDSNGNEITNVEYNPANGSYEFTYRISVKNTVQNSYPATIPAQTITDDLSQLTEKTYKNGGVEIISATATEGTINSDYKITNNLIWTTTEIGTTEQHLDIKVKVTADAFEKTSQGTENLISSMDFSTSNSYFIDKDGNKIKSDYQKINDTDGTVNIFLRTKNTTNKNNGYIYAGTVSIGNTRPNEAIFATTDSKYQGDNADDNINKALQNTSTAINLAKDFERNKSIISKYFVNNTLPTINEIANNVNSLYGGDITIDTENQVIIWYKVVNTADARLKRTYTIDRKTRTVQLEECSYHLDGIIVDKKDLGMDINDGTTVQISNTIGVTVPKDITVVSSLTSNVILTYKKPTLTNN